MPWLDKVEFHVNDNEGSFYRDKHVIGTVGLNSAVAVSPEMQKEPDWEERAKERIRRSMWLTVFGDIICEYEILRLCCRSLPETQERALDGERRKRIIDSLEKLDLLLEYPGK